MSRRAETTPRQQWELAGPAAQATPGAALVVVAPSAGRQMGCGGAGAEVGENGAAVPEAEAAHLAWPAGMAAGTETAAAARIGVITGPQMCQECTGPAGTATSAETAAWRDQSPSFPEEPQMPLAGTRRAGSQGTKRQFLAESRAPNYQQRPGSSRIGPPGRCPGATSQS